MNRLINGEALEQMQKLIDEGIKVDAIICDPPYGTTSCKWDSVINLDEMWAMLKQLVKDDNTPIVLFGAQPFTSKLVSSNLKGFKYNWVWDKTSVSNPQNAKYQPLRHNEDILVFTSRGKRAFYKPQGLVKVNKTIHSNGVSESEKLGHIVGRRSNGYIQEFTNYPKQTLNYKKVARPEHPTQKPVELMEYLVKTYTNEGDVVLDFTMGSGSTGVACKNLNRNFIGIELDEQYYEIAKERITNE